MNVSQAYIAAITAPTEQTTFSAEFGFVPPGSREGMSLSASGLGLLWGSRLAQLNNGSLGMGAKWASIERNRMALGMGGRYIDRTIAQQTGDWSTAQSREDGTFESPPWVEMALDKAYNLIGVQIIFDDLGAEWATQVAVSYYNASKALLGERVFNNRYASMSVDWQYDGVRYVKITPLAWNLPRRFAKICQVIPGQVRYFRDDDVFSFVLREKISPYDTLTIPEYMLTFSNDGQVYNIINPEGLIAKLREMMPISSQIGLVTAAGVENISTGAFPLFSWPNDADDEIATFYCRPDLAFTWRDYTYETLTTRTVAATAADISTLARLAAPVVVDSTLQGLAVNGNIGHGVPLQSALGQLAVAANGYIKFERDGTYKLKPLAFGAPVRTISFENMWTKPQITQPPIMSGVNVRYSVHNTTTGRMDAMEYFISSGNESGKVQGVSSNFIRNQSEAQRIGNAALSFYLNRLQYVIDFRGDMSIEPGDVVSVETDYGFKNVLVLEHEIKYDNVNFLQGKLKGVQL